MRLYGSEGHGLLGLQLLVRDYLETSSSEIQSAVNGNSSHGERRTIRNNNRRLQLIRHRRQMYVQLPISVRRMTLMQRAKLVTEVYSVTS